jgi:hypothetical protein
VTAAPDYLVEYGWIGLAVVGGVVGVIALAILIRAYRDK